MGDARFLYERGGWTVETVDAARGRARDGGETDEEARV
jgi:hypothetical protein